MWWVVLFTSIALIGIGGLLLLKDVTRSKTATSKSTAVPIPADAAIPQSGTGISEHAEDTRAAAFEPPATRTVTAPPLPPRLPAVEHLWPRVRVDVDAAVNAVNLSATALALSIGPPGEPTWSLHNRGYGDYRRILLGNDSIAWLRMEVGADRILTTVVRAHDAANAVLNRTRTLPPPHEAGRIATLLTDCLTPAIDMANRRRQASPRAEAIQRPAPAPPPASAPSPSAKSPPLPPMASDTPRTGPGIQTLRPATAPDSLIDTAITLVNKAFVETGARLEPAREPLRREPIGPGDRALSITVAGTSVGLMLIESLPDRIDISVGVADLANFGSARRQSQPRAGMTMQSLAETIATCAWPAIATAPASVA